MMNLREFRRWNDYSTVGISFVANTLILLLALTERNATLRSYSKMIVLSCVLDYFFCFVSISTVIDAIVQDHVFLTISDGIFRFLPLTYHYFFTGIHIFAVGLMTVTVPIDYLYRYVLIVRKRELSIAELISAISFCCLIVFASTFLFVYAFVQEEKDLDQYGHLLAGDGMWLEADGQPARFIATDCTNPFFLLALFISATVATAAYVLVVFLGVSIYRELTSMRAIASRKTLRLQRSMSIVLIIKAVFPFLCSTLPVFFLIFSVSLGLNIPNLGLFLVIVNSWIPVISPLSTLLLLSGYRRRLLNGFRHSSVAQQIGKTYRSSQPSIMMNSKTN
ncbi:hypothetical protein M3Y99_01782500 [Aphelenchoides fujianensis]|nr:hypothetical protein M3Y99_01782500 [Aphelenchoides fujianensis]